MLSVFDFAINFGTLQQSQLLRAGPNAKQFHRRAVTGLSFASRKQQKREIMDAKVDAAGHCVSFAHARRRSGAKDDLHKTAQFAANAASIA